MQGCLVWGALHARAQGLLFTMPYRWEGGSLGGWVQRVGGWEIWVGGILVGGWVGGLRVGVRTD